MGCDIHLHVEVKIEGTWEHWGNPQIDRWYSLFAKMAGVRADYNDIPISKPRGLPSDITKLTWLDSKHWGSDAHSQSWLSSQEIEEQLCPWIEENGEKESLRNWPEKYFGYLYGNGWDMQNAKKSGVEDFRFVFWFDN